MFERKLQSLDYHRVDGIDINDETQIRQLIAWIEDQKIRHYKIGDRRGLRDVDSKEWDIAFEKYLKDMECPFGANQKPLVVDWILTLAIRLEYEDNVQKYQTLTVDDMKRVTQTSGKDSDFDCLDFGSNEFKEGVKELAHFLKVPTHPTDHLMTLRAISIVFRNHISMENKDKSDVKSNKRPQMDKIEDNSMALRVGNDKVLTNCAKVVRLLYINDLRQLQTNVNDIIASVQSITANPKTDTSLGRLGL